MSIVEKIKNFWLGSEETYEDGFDELFSVENSSPKNQQTVTDPTPISTKSSKVKEFSSPAHLKVLDQANPYSATNEVVVLEPTNFSQAPEVIQYLRRGSSVVLNLYKLDEEQSQRLIDFVCGGIYAIDGSQRRVGEGVFLLVPSNVNINTIQKEAKDSKLSFWTPKGD